MIPKKILVIPKATQERAQLIDEKTDDTPLTISVDEMGRKLGISRKTAFKLAHQPGFPSIRIGGRLLVNYQALLLWIEKRTAEANQ